MHELFEILTTRLKSIPLIKGTQIYNSQVANMAEEKATKYPCVYVEIANVRALSRPQLMEQDMSATLRLRIVNRDAKQGNSPLIYSIKDQVHQYMNKFSGQGKFRGLMRTGEILSYNHDNVYEYQLEYILAWKDVTPPVVNEEEVEIDSLNLSFDLDIDSPVIRAGDNESYVFPTSVI